MSTVSGEDHGRDRIQTRHFVAAATRPGLPTSIYVTWANDPALSIPECGFHPHKSVGQNVDAPWVGWSRAGFVSTGQSPSWPVWPLIYHLWIWPITTSKMPIPFNTFIHVISFIVIYCLLSLFAWECCHIGVVDQIRQTAATTPTIYVKKHHYNEEQSIKKKFTFEFFNKIALTKVATSYYK